MHVFQFSVSQIEYPLGGSIEKGCHVYFLLITSMILPLWCQIVLLWHQVTMVASSSIKTTFISNNSRIWQNNIITKKKQQLCTFVLVFYVISLFTFITVHFNTHRLNYCWLTLCKTTNEGSIPQWSIEDLHSDPMVSSRLKQMLLNTLTRLVRDSYYLKCNSKHSIHRFR